MAMSFPNDARPALSLKASLVLALIALVIAYIGYSAVRGALQTRSDNIALAQESARASGRIIDHDSYTDSSAQRKTWYKPVVAYTVDGRDYQVTAQNGVDLTTAMTELKVGSAIEVVYPRTRPADARVVGLEFESWIGLAIFGGLMMLIPLALMAWGIIRRVLFARSKSG